MFFTIEELNAKDDLFSYLLCKNPSSIYDRDRVLGKYKILTKYEVISNINKSEITKILKERNEESYVNYHYEGVTPLALNDIFTSLRSALTKNYPDENIINASEIERDLVSEIGPFIVSQDKFIETFDSYGLSCEVLDSGSSNTASTFKISGKNKLYIFLQKVFIISMYFTFKNKLFDIQSAQLEKYIRLSESWMNSNINTKYIIRTFCSNNKSLESKFIDKLNFDKEDSEELKESLYINYDTLHSIRHKFICDRIEAIASNNFSSKLVVVDYGCANGKLSLLINDRLKKMNGKEFTINSYDINDRAYDKLKYVKNINFYQMNLLVPNFNIIPDRVDVLILSEIIEHFDKDDRQQILYKIVESINPKYVILTTPNKEYNSILGVPDGEFREKTHKIEFTKDEYINEIENYYIKNDYLEATYSFDENKEIISGPLGGATFISIFENLDIDRKVSYKSTDAYASYYLPISDYVISPKEFASGYSSRSFISNKNIFYIAPTVPPVDYDEEFPDNLEDPRSAFKYFKDRNIHEIVGENKYMGSRCHILLFKTEKLANKYGFNKKISIISRNGYEFFYGDGERYLDEFYNGLDFSNITEDILILDAEMMPWKYKAENLIRYKFQGVGEVSELNRRFCGLDTTNSELFNKSLNNYINDDEVYCRVFGILAYAYDSGRNLDWVLGSCISNTDKMDIIYRICHNSNNKKFRPVEQTIIDLNDERSIELEVSYWNKYTNSGGEGRVYKPITPRQYCSNGYMIQPMLKVRGKEYLRIIYGIDYLDPENFKIIKNRSIKKKRIQAIQETELSDMILNSFINNRKGITSKLVAGFLGTENVTFSNVDKTL